MKTNIYIDGFNFYYGCIKGTDTAADHYHHLMTTDPAPAQPPIQ